MSRSEVKLQVLPSLWERLQHKDQEHKRLFFNSELKTWYHAAPSQAGGRDVESDLESVNSIASNDGSDIFDEGGTLDEGEDSMVSAVACTGL